MTKKVDYIIVGQGIAGTLLAFFLLKKGKKVLVIDKGYEKASSIVAAGTINPITGRKYVKSWRIEELLPFAKETYTELADFLAIKTFTEKNILRVLFSIEDENTWLSRSGDPMAKQYIVDPPDPSECEDLLHNAPAYGELTGSMQVHLGDIIRAMREHLISVDALVEEDFDHDQFSEDVDTVQYKEVTAHKVFFAEGHQVVENPYFKDLPWQAVKGEVLIVRIPGAPFQKVVRHRIFITHIKEDLYWVGSAYIHGFEDHLPTEAEGKRLEEELKSILKAPFEIVDHIAGIRPAVRGRRPIMGPHPKHPNVVLFNGLGTKGASLGPYFAKHLVDHVVDDSNLEAEVTRFW